MEITNFKEYTLKSDALSIVPLACSINIFLKHSEQDFVIDFMCTKRRKTKDYTMIW